MSNNTKTTEQVLGERKTTHGDYSDHALCTQNILSVITSGRNWNILSPEQKESIHMIAHKLARIAVGDPDVNDHWDDIAGYATLVSQRMPGSACSHRITLPSLKSKGHLGGGSGVRGFDPELDVVDGEEL